MLVRQSAPRDMHAQAAVCSQTLGCWQSLTWLRSAPPQSQPSSRQGLLPRVSLCLTLSLLYVVQTTVIGLRAQYDLV